MGASIFIKDSFKPPMIVFSVTLSLLAVILFSYSSALINSKILHPEIQNWKNFYKTVSALSVCLVSNSELINTVHQKTDKAILNQDIKMTNISYFTKNVVLHIDKIKQKNYFVHAILNAKDLGYYRSEDKIQMKISFSKTKNSFACVSFTGPSYLLPNPNILYNNHPCSQPEKEAKHHLVFMTPEDVSEKTSCKSGHYGSLSIQEDNNMYIYLSKRELSGITQKANLVCLLMLVPIVIMIILSLNKRMCLANDTIIDDSLNEADSLNEVVLSSNKL